MTSSFLNHLQSKISEASEKGLYKYERIIDSPQQASITLTSGKKYINLCSNNYLGLANHPSLIEAGKKALSRYGYGMASVRFICGTQSIHKTLEKRLSLFLKTEDTILYSSCFDANTGLFETLLTQEDAIISDALNHASIIDGVRLCKSKRFRYKNNDMFDLEAQLIAADTLGARYKLIATDGIFSMDGSLANLRSICDLSEKYNAIVMVDDSHAVGFMGSHGRGTPEHCQVMDRVDIITGTFGKALGGASGGYTSGKKAIIEWLRQASRPYLFSNTLAPVMAAVSLEVIDLLESRNDLRQKLHSNALYFRTKMTALGFTLLDGEHPIVPIMLYDAALAESFAHAMLNEGVYVVNFSFPVVPNGGARIRTQMSADHSIQDLDRAISAFQLVGQQLGVI
jgi:glycine C-acetyltransferase